MYLMYFEYFFNYIVDGGIYLNISIGMYWFLFFLKRL